MVLGILGSILAAALLGGGLWLYAPDQSRTALEARYFAGHAQSIEAAGIRLNVRDEGERDAPAVILLHGFGSSLLTWDAWAAPLARDHRVVRFDLPGFGLTGPDPANDYSDERAGIILAALMDRLGIGRATVVGNSLGGKIAWLFAVRHPDRVAKLVLISPDGFASPGFEYGKAPEIPFLLRLLPYVLPQPLLRASLLPAYADPARLTDATIRRYRDMMLAPGVRRAIIARTGQVLLQDPRPLLRQIQAPTLLLWGEKDGMIPFRNAADYLREIPNATLVALPGLGHVPFEEAPDEAFAPFSRFIDQK